MHASSSSFFFTSSRATLCTGWLLLTAGLLGLSNPARAQLPHPQQTHAAVVMAIAGQAKAVDTQGRERLLEKGAQLYAGDKVVTADASLVQVRLNDGGYMSVRPNTEMVIDQFVFDEKEPLSSRFLVSLVRGGFRSITGLIGRNNPTGYQIRTPTATVGIRGTDHEPVLVLDTPESQAQNQQSPPGLYDKVNEGETFITSRGVVLPLRRGDVGFAPLNTNLPPQVLLKIPEFYKIDLKTDARDPRDGSGGTADGSKTSVGGTTGGLLRPSLSARREALTNSGGSADGQGQIQNQGLGATAPAAQQQQQQQPQQQQQQQQTTTPRASTTTTNNNTLVSPTPANTTPRQQPR